MSRLTIGIVVILTILTLCPASALKVYLNPSIQIDNYSPDGTYQEGSSMQDVAWRVLSKLTYRGISARNSAWMSLADACYDSNTWGPNCFVSLHTNATGAGGWGSLHGTTPYFHQETNGTYNGNCASFSTTIGNKVVSKFGQFGVGYNRGARGDWYDVGFMMYVLAPWYQAAIPSTLVEGLFHDNYNDTQVLKRPEGREAYAQGVYEGICDYYGWAYGKDKYAYWPYKSNGQVTVAPGNGLMEIFVKGANGNLYHAWQTSPNGYFTDWSNFGGTLASDPVAVINYSGGNEVFYRQTDGNLYHRWQVGPGGPWYGPESLGAVLGRPCVGRTADGHLEVFAHMSDNAIWHKWQDGNGFWGTWQSLGSWCTNDPIVGMTNYGSQELFIVGSGNQVYHRWQTSVGGAWSDWYSIGGNAVGTVEVGLTSDCQPDVFVQWADNGVTDNAQAPAGGWGGWTSQALYPPAGFLPVAARNSVGSQEIFAVGADRQIYHKWQAYPGSDWGNWYSLGGYTVRSPLVSHHDDGRTAVFEVNPDGHMYANWQSGGGWTGWMQLGGQIF